MFPIKLNQGISPWHQKCYSFENEEQQLKIKLKNHRSIQKSTSVSRNQSAGRSTPQIGQSLSSHRFQGLLKRKFSNAGSDLERLERLHLPRTVSMKKPVEERKVLEQVQVKEFIMLGEKPIQIYRKKDSFRASFVIKHKLNRQKNKEKENDASELKKM